MAISPEEMAALERAYERAGTLQLKEIENRYQLGQDQLRNAFKIASLQSRDARYGIEAERDIKRQQLALAREEMERVGIPRMEIERYVAEKNYEIAQSELAWKKEQFAQEFGLATADITGYYQDRPTLEREELDRRYGLDVAQFAAELGSTPDRYYQARLFENTMVPRLMGLSATGTPTPQVYGGPTPQLATLGARLAGYDPAMVGQAAGTPVAAGGAGSTTAAATTTPTDDRAKQLSAIAKAVPPSPYDGLTEQDANAVKLMESIYKAGGQAVPGGELERLEASGNLGFLRSAGTLLGYDPTSFEAQYKAYRPTQGSASLA